jgi:hypothetical protein
MTTVNVRFGTTTENRFRKFQQTYTENQNKIGELWKRMQAVEQDPAKSNKERAQEWLSLAEEVRRHSQIIEDAHKEFLEGGEEE